MRKMSPTIAACMSTVQVMPSFRDIQYTGGGLPIVHFGVRIFVSSAPFWRMSQNAMRVKSSIKHLWIAL